MEIDDITSCVASVSKWLEKYDRVFLVKDGDDCCENLTALFCEFLYSCEKKENILVLSSTLPLRFFSVNAIKIDSLMEEKIIKLFHLYSFSDKFQLLAESDNQGSIFNFVRRGQLSMENVFLALVE